MSPGEVSVLWLATTEIKTCFFAYAQAEAEALEWWDTFSPSVCIFIPLLLSQASKNLFLSGQLNVSDF